MKKKVPKLKSQPSVLESQKHSQSKLIVAALGLIIAANSQILLWVQIKKLIGQFLTNYGRNFGSLSKKKIRAFDIFSYSVGSIAQIFSLRNFCWCKSFRY